MLKTLALAATLLSTAIMAMEEEEKNGLLPPSTTPLIVLAKSAQYLGTSNEPKQASPHHTFLNRIEVYSFQDADPKQKKTFCLERINDLLSKNPKDQNLEGAKKRLKFLQYLYAIVIDGPDKIIALQSIDPIKLATMKTFNDPEELQWYCNKILDSLQSEEERLKILVSSDPSQQYNLNLNQIEKSFFIDLLNDPTKKILKFS